MKSFTTFIKENLDSLTSNHIHSFLKHGESDEAKNQWGEKLSVLHKEPGSCSMVSNDLVKHLHKHGIKNAKTVTGSNPTNKKWNDVVDDLGQGGHHTVVKIGQHVVDLTRGQFEHNAPRVHIQHIDDFKKEWGNVI